MVDIGAIAAKVLSGEWDGAMLASEQSAGRLTKGERRSIMKQVSKARKNKSIDEKCVESTCISREVHEEEHEEEGGVGKSNKRKVDESEIERKEIVVESVVMNSKQKKNAIKLLNKELNSCALKKQLNEAKRKVRAALKKGLVLDVHSYTNLINCYARCGDVYGARGTLESMIEEGVEPNVITWTALLKGCCDSGDLYTGRSIFLYDMLQLAHDGNVKPFAKPTQAKKRAKAVDPSLFPNERSLATLLRGCQRLGAISIGLESYRVWHDTTSRYQAQIKDGGEQDQGLSTACIVYVIGMCAQKLSMKDASDIASSGLSLSMDNTNKITDKSTLDQASVALSIARGYAVMGLVPQARAWAGISSTCAKQSKSSSLLRAMQSHSHPLPSVTSSSSSSKGAASVGNLFQTHQRAEIEADLASLALYLSSLARSQASSDIHKKALSQQLSRFLIIGLDGLGDLHEALVKGPANMETQEDEDGDGVSKKAEPLTGSHLYSALQEKCGISTCGALSTEQCAEIERRLHDSVSGGIIEFPHVCASSSSSSRPGSSTMAKKPLKLEIGAGAGEWVVAQAAADRGRAEWLAMELRCDRAYQIFCKQLFSALPAMTRAGEEDCGNLTVIAGDANKIMHENVNDEAVSAIFVNHPEPPERSMVVDKRTGAGNGNHSAVSPRVQGKHMLTRSFFISCGRILQAEGTISIVTDSLPYGKLLIEIVASLPTDDHSFESVDAGDEEEDDDVGSAEKVEFARKNAAGTSICLWRGEPGVACGHSTIASSYFDRLWKTGNKKRRWYLYLRKKK